jgi:hypothetical protein
MISKVLRNLRFSLNQPLKSVVDKYFGILKNVIKTCECVDFLFFKLKFPCNLTRCRLGDFYLVFITFYLKSNIIYIQPLGPPPKRNILSAPLLTITEKMADFIRTYSKNTDHAYLFVSTCVFYVQLLLPSSI